MVYIKVDNENFKEVEPIQKETPHNIPELKERLISYKNEVVRITNLIAEGEKAIGTTEAEPSAEATEA